MTQYSDGSDDDTSSDVGDSDTSWETEDEREIGSGDEVQDEYVVWLFSKYTIVWLSFLIFVYAHQVEGGTAFFNAFYFLEKL